MIKTQWIVGCIDDLEDAHGIRRKVFVEEQGLPEEVEIDGSDEGSFLLVAYDGEHGVATGRIYMEGDKYMIGHIAVLKEERGKKLGDFVVRLLIRKAFEIGATKQYVCSQVSTKGFYEKLGFSVYGEEIEKAGIPHIYMVHEGDIVGEC